jgi:hypothetical protein
VLMPKLIKKDTPTTVEKDAVLEAIRKAVRAAQSAQKEAYGDVRTSSSVCTDHLDAAVKSLESAAQWMRDYRKEVLADERQSTLPPNPTPKPKEECHICESEINPGDVAICGGCDRPTCPECMGDEGICKECETEAE